MTHIAGMSPFKAQTVYANCLLSPHQEELVLGREKRKPAMVDDDGFITSAVHLSFSEHVVNQRKYNPIDRHLPLTVDLRNIVLDSAWGGI